MKIKNILLAFFLTLISVTNMMATPEPCPDGNCDEQLPGASIDQYLVYLIIGALALGIVIIHRDKIKKLQF